MHEHPLAFGQLEMLARRRMVRLGYYPGDLESLELHHLITATEALGLPSPHLLATLAIVQHDLPRIPIIDDERPLCIVCHHPIRRALWLIGDKHVVHGGCRPIAEHEADDSGRPNDT